MYWKLFDSALHKPFIYEWKYTHYSGYISMLVLASAGSNRDPLNYNCDLCITEAI